MRSRIGPVFAAAFLLTCDASLAATPRIASMNVCTDQLLLSLADPAQILGLSRYAREDRESWAAGEVRQFPVLSGGAEDVLMLDPDIVVASLFDRRSTREFLKRNGIRLVEFSVPRTMDEVKAQIRAMGDITGHPNRADTDIARIDAAVARARQAVGGKSYRVLPLSRRGWISGSDSVTGALLKEVGLRNAADELDARSGGFASLEAIIALKPDLLLVSEAGDRAEDEGSALLLHPALERFYPPEKRLVIPERLTMCGGVMLADALDVLVAELRRVGR